jgi:hypothetical protein
VGRIVILEGPDGCGKTTLAKELVALGWVYRHDGLPPKDRDNIAYYLEKLWIAMNSIEDTVFDRFWLGERIYGPVVRNRDTIGDDGQKLFTRIHRSNSIHQYICLPKLDVARANYAIKITDPNDYLQSSLYFEMVYQRYLSWAFRHATMAELFDYERNSVNDILMDFSLDEENSILPLPIGMVGQRIASHLFIGDTANHPYIDIPFHSLRNSSDYFNRAVVLARIREEELAISNAFSPIGVPHKVQYMDAALPFLTDVILMGSAAAKWYHDSPIKFKIRVHQVCHPSYAKRFHDPNPLFFANEIRKALSGNSNKGK